MLLNVQVRDFLLINFPAFALISSIFWPAAKRFADKMSGNEFCDVTILFHLNFGGN